jgi:hypothetical protein
MKIKKIIGYLLITLFASFIIWLYATQVPWWTFLIGIVVSTILTGFGYLVIWLLSDNLQEEVVIYGAEEPKDYSFPDLGVVKSFKECILLAEDQDGELKYPHTAIYSKAKEMYASQFKHAPAIVVPTDEEIEAYIEKSLPGWKSDGEWTGKAYSMRNMANWMRSKLTGEEA